jgi:hypothetical protein
MTTTSSLIGHLSKVAAFRRKAKVHIPRGTKGRDHQRTSRSHSGRIGTNEIAALTTAACRIFTRDRRLMRGIVGRWIFTWIKARKGDSYDGIMSRVLREQGAVVLRMARITKATNFWWPSSLQKRAYSLQLNTRYRSSSAQAHSTSA